MRQHSYQKRGVGRELLAHIEDYLISREARLLIVETAGISEFDYVRRFYSANGFVDVAKIPDFYDNAVGKVVFTKALSSGF
jgi:ribosomal protein S18 acetylase RimI-like enzyme